MKRLLTIFILLSMMLTLIPLASAAPASAINDLVDRLAVYYPGHTVIFGAMLTDDGAFETLETVLNRVIVGLGEDSIAMQALQDEAAAEFDLAGDFDSVVGSWLGDGITFGIPSIQAAITGMANDAGPFMIAIHTDNPQAAEVFWGAVLGRDGYQFQREDEHVLFLAERRQRDPSVMITGDAVLIAPNPVLLTREPASTLDQNDQFKQSLAQLPRDDYGALLYLDYQGIYTPLMSFASMGSGADTMTGLEPFTEIVGPQAIGFAVERRSLIMDYAQSYNQAEVSDLEAMGFTTLYEAAPVDPGFAAHIPADAALFYQGTELGPATLTQFENWRAMSPMMQAMLQAQVAQMEPFLSPTELQSMQMLYGAFMDPAQWANAVNFMFAGFTGLNLEQDVLPWMDGDAAMFLRFISGDDVSFTVDGGLAVEVGDSEGAALLMESLREALDLYRAQYAIETVGEAEVIVLPNIIGSLLPEDQFTAPALKAPELHILLGATETLYTAGTREAARFMLTPGEDTLENDPIYQAAARYLLEDTMYIAYFNTARFDPMFTFLLRRAGNDLSLASDIEDIHTLISIIESGSISGVMEDDGGGALIRFVLTLAE